MRRRTGRRVGAAVRRRLSRLLLVVALAGCAGSAARTLVLASTTSLDDSGLLAVLLPAFEREHSDLQVRLIAVGTGQALELARRGDADVLLVHSPPDEERFMAEGHGTARAQVMENDFVVVGPPTDPAQAAGARDVLDALRRIDGHGATWLSRGDSSGTHRLELRLRRELDAADGASLRIVEAGQGMAETLGIASERRAYTLTDRATFSTLRDRLELRIVHEGDASLRNVYSVIVTSRGRAPDAAVRFAQWLQTERARQLIATFGTAEGGPSLFTPIAGPGSTGE